MGLDNILDQLEGFSVNFGRERGRDPSLYYITIFGEPGGDAPWGWRFGGHHVSLHYTIIGGEVVASTPNFLGADPADSPLLGPASAPPARGRGGSRPRAVPGARRGEARKGAGLAGGAARYWSAATVRSSRPATGRSRSTADLSPPVRRTGSTRGSWPHAGEAESDARPRGCAPRRPELHRRAERDRGRGARCRPDLDPARAARLLSRASARRARRSAGDAWSSASSTA